jgi:hypothetical protein
MVAVAKQRRYNSVHPPPPMPRCATALNFVIPPAPACRGSVLRISYTLHQPTATYAAFFKETRTRFYRRH